MKRYIHASEEVAEYYTDQDLISAIWKASKTRRPIDFAIAEEILHDVLKEGDQIFIEYPNGKMYPFTFNKRREFTARIPSEYAYETNGYVATHNIIGEEIFPCIRKGRRWYLNLTREEA